MSEVKVNKISPRSGTDVTLGDSGDTFTIPAGATLTNNGTASGFGISWQSDIKTSAFTAVAGEGYWINTTSAAITVTLPASASVGDEIEFTDYARTWGTNAVTLNPNSLNYQGNSSPNPEYNTDGQHVRIVYSGATQGWIPTVDDDVTLETPQTYSADFLVIAGGGGGGFDDGGGGGAGGYRTSTQSISPGTVYTITVGDGGAGASSVANGTNGSDSSISGSDITDITSAGGGGGASDTISAANNGGSGGGGGGKGAPYSGGSGNTPSTSPSQGFDGADGTNTNVVCGGGGGAGEAGNTDGPAHGGDGLSSSITGSAVVRGGGGAGSNRINPQSPAPGGDGGGGNGGTDTPNNVATSGTANTGGGGGGGAGSTPKNGGNGGKGVVIISVPTANYSSTTTGSPTVTTSGANTIMQFNGSGSYTG